MSQKIDGIVDVDHPSIVSTVRNMIRQGYEKETIMRTVGVDASVVDSHRINMEKYSGVAPQPTVTDGAHKEMLDRMAKMREKRKQKKANPVAEELGAKK